MKYLSEVKKNQTVVRVVAYSKSSSSGTNLITFEYEAYRGILSELNTHGLLCRNAESSRAVPVKKRIEQIRNNPYVPVYWGSNQAGMVAGEEINTPLKFPVLDHDDDIMDYEYVNRDEAWGRTANDVANLMESWDDAGYHKQIVNRIGEAFTTVKGVITATEWDNFFHLRRAPDADPAIKELADCMWEAMKEVEEKGLVEVLHPGEYHTPYVGHYRHNGKLYYLPIDSESFWDAKLFTLEQALKTSSVACGQISFRKLDTSEETVERVWKRLMEGDTIHASVVQHQGTPIKSYRGCFGYNKDGDEDSVFPQAEINKPNFPHTWEEGISHMDRNQQLWSGQFKNWIMYRKLIPNEACNNYIDVKEN